ncbi:MAR-binding filament-like protein 1 isoform 2 [Hibiscus syriacus]|uniref:MAR-binding filament-like protein 1 isoform 2 n=1 Tax=Hibiscus syriacus TaxID=106335 RepID=A0A6A2XE18_HIBSY|nr:MAR-binding filament-like protein 1 isoform 2 [Hibiscus syriacus]
MIGSGYPHRSGGLHRIHLLPRVLDAELVVEYGASGSRGDLVCDGVVDGGGAMQGKFEKHCFVNGLCSEVPVEASSIVAELSEPTSLEAREAVHSVVHELLATLSPTMHSKVPPFLGNPATGAVNNVVSEDCIEFVENASLLKPTILLTRDYLARFLFWCMLLGHYLRGLEYRMELIELSSTRSPEDNGGGDEEVI